MIQAVNGRYRGGRVELDEVPSGIGDSRIVVLFLSNDAGSDVSKSRESALARVLWNMRKGLSFGGPPYPSREELHDRFG